MTPPYKDKQIVVGAQQGYGRTFRWIQHDMGQRLGVVFRQQSRGKMPQNAGKQWQEIQSSFTGDQLVTCQRRAKMSGSVLRKSGEYCKEKLAAGAWRKPRILALLGGVSQLILLTPLLWGFSPSGAFADGVDTAAGKSGTLAAKTEGLLKGGTEQPSPVLPAQSVAQAGSGDDADDSGSGDAAPSAIAHPGASSAVPASAVASTAANPADSAELKKKAADLLSIPVIKQIAAQHQMMNEYQSGLDNEPIGGGVLERYLPLTPAPPRQTGWLPSSFDDWMRWQTMTGDWNGWRPWLIDQGVTFSGRWLEDSGANLTGGMSQTVQYADEEAFSLDFNLQKLMHLDRDLGTFHFTTAIRQGHSLAQSMPALDSPMEIAGSGEWAHLTKLSWEFQWNRYLRTEVGELNSEDQFEASSTYWGANLYCQFESNAICGMPQSIAMNSGYGWYPTAHPGAWAKFFPTGTNEWMIQTGVYSVDPTIQNKGNGWKMGLKGATGSFVPFQVRWHKGGPDDYSGPFQTNITVGAYWDSSEVDDVYSKLGMFTIVPPANAAKYKAGIPAALQGIIGPRKIRNRHGAYFQADSLLQRDRDDPRRSTAGFFSFTWGNRAASPAPYFITAGVTRKGTFASRPEDTVSLGMKALWASSKLSHEIRTMRGICEGGSSAEFCSIGKRSGGLYTPGMESALEFNYGYRPAWWALIRPGIQYIWRPGGTSRYKDAFLLDLEAGVTF